MPSPPTVALLVLSSSMCRAVYVWHYPLPPSWAGPYLPGSVYDVPEVDPEEVRARSEARLAGVVAQADATGTVVEQEVIEGHPAEGLLYAARDAELLVVGSCGHGGFTGLLLGSVSQACVHHAHCPVVVVRAGEGAAQFRVSHGPEGGGERAELRRIL